MKIIDVGFNRGGFTASIGLGLDRVSAVEANPTLKTGAVELLESLVGEGNFNYWSHACSDKTGDVIELHLGDDELLSTCSTEFKERERYKDRYSHKIEVTTVSLDTIIETDGVPDLIKIDVEGYEPEVVRGLSTPVDYIIFEFSGELPQHILDCKKHLDSLTQYEYGYVINPPERYGEYLEAPLNFEEGKIEDVLIPMCEHDPTIWGMVWARRVGIGR